MRDLAKSQSRLRMSGPPHQPRARASGPRCRRCLPRPPAPAATAGRPFGSARRLHPRDVAVAERFLDRYVFRCTHPPRPSNLRCAAQLLPSETPPPAQGRHHQTLPHGRAASSVCRSARPGPLAAAWGGTPACPRSSHPHTQAEPRTAAREFWRVSQGRAWRVTKQGKFAPSL